MDHVAQLKALKEDLWRLVDKLNCNPILLRLAWHDAGTYDKAKTAFGAFASMEIMEKSMRSERFRRVSRPFRASESGEQCRGERGGANGSIRFSPELSMGANNGLDKAAARPFVPENVLGVSRGEVFGAF